MKKGDKVVKKREKEETNIKWLKKHSKCETGSRTSTQCVVTIPSSKHNEKTVQHSRKSNENEDMVSPKNLQQQTRQIEISEVGEKYIKTNK